MKAEQSMYPGEGDEELSEGGNNGSLAEDGRDTPKSRRSRKSRAGSRTRPSDVGRALRSVYDSTLREEVPSDFKDLLGKLT